MSRKWSAALLTAAACAVCLARPAAAQLGASDLPDLSGLAGAIADSVKAPPVKKLAPDVLYRSGLAVPAVHPGETARGIGRQLREKLEAKAGPNTSFQKLEDGMPAMLTSFEDYMQKHGVAKRDMGVAMGVFIELNWETANKQELSEAAAANVVQTFGALTAAKYKARYATLAPAVKEKQYESLLISPMLLNILAKQLDKAGKAQEAVGVRASAAKLFTQIVGTDPDQVQISADGRTINVKPRAPAGAAVPDTPPVGPTR